MCVGVSGEGAHGLVCGILEFAKLKVDVVYIGLFTLLSTRMRVIQSQRKVGGGQRGNQLFVAPQSIVVLLLSLSQLLLKLLMLPKLTLRAGSPLPIEWGRLPFVLRSHG